jgi:hypothetical protein
MADDGFASWVAEQAVRYRAPLWKQFAPRQASKRSVTRVKRESGGVGTAGAGSGAGVDALASPS